MPTSPPSRAPHAQGNPPIHDSWVRNYESVDYDVPLLHPQAHLDSGDEEEEVKGGRQDRASGRGEMPSQTDQPPRTPPKNPSLSPKSVKGNASADPRLPTPGRSPSHTRGPSFQSSSSSTPTKSAQQQGYYSAGQQLYASALGAPIDMNRGAVAEKQMAAGSIGSITTGNVTDLSHQSSLSTTTATAGGAAQTATPTSRSPRSSSFRSSPLAASASASTPAPGVKIPNSYPPQASPSTVRTPPTSSGSNTSSSMPSSSPQKAALNTSPPMSSPHSMGASSSSYTPPSSFFPPQQGSSSTQHPPTMPNTPYSQVPHPNANNPPFAKPGTRPNPGPTNNNNSHMNPAYIQRIASEENRIFGGPQLAAGQVAGPDGGSGRGSPHSQSTFVHAGASGVGIGLRDPGFSGNSNNNNNYHNNQQPQLNTSGSRGSMILYRLSATEDGMLPPPGVPGSVGRRGSVYSNSGDSIVSLSGDSKYPLVGFGSGTRTPGTPGRPGTPGTPGNGSIGNRGGPLSMSEIGKVHGGLVAYMYDPGQDLDADELDEEEEDWVKTVGGHVIRGDVKGLGTFGNANVRMNVKTGKVNGKAPIRTSKHTPPSSSGVPWRGLVNVTTLVVLILGLLCLFLLYPVWRAYNNNGVDQLILGNTRINSTGQAVSLDAVDKREWKLPEFNRDLQ